jgi:hypothetical protein
LHRLRGLEIFVFGTPKTVKQISGPHEKKHLEKAQLNFELFCNINEQCTSFCHMYRFMSSRFRIQKAGFNVNAENEDLSLHTMLWYPYGYMYHSLRNAGIGYIVYSICG